jgi:hypothetical protein
VRPRLLTSSGNVSQHSSGNAVDIAQVNGIPIVGHQGKGSITDLTIQRLLTLQGTMKPDQIISLMTFDGADNTLALADHYDHIHVGWKPLYGTNSKAAKQVNAVLKPNQWIKLIGPPEGDRQPDGQPPAVEVLREGHAARVRRARERVARLSRTPPGGRPVGCGAAAVERADLDAIGHRRARLAKVLPPAAAARVTSVSGSAGRVESGGSGVALEPAEDGVRVAVGRSHGEPDDVEVGGRDRQGPRRGCRRRCR